MFEDVPVVLIVLLKHGAYGLIGLDSVFLLDWQQESVKRRRIVMVMIILIAFILVAW